MERNAQPPIEALFQESYRQLLHIAVALFIIPLRWFGFRYAIGFAIAAFLWNLMVMPRWFKDSFRPSEKQKGYSTGMLVYPISILVMAVLFPLPIMAAGWAVLSVSDGFATLFGKLLGKKSLPWNKKKTWIGLFSFWISASIFGLLAFLWANPNILESSPFSRQVLYLLSRALYLISGLSAPGNFFYSHSYNNHLMVSHIISKLFVCSCLSALFAAFIESLPLSKLDDNIIAPISYALFLSVVLGLFWIS